MAIFKQSGPAILAWGICTDFLLLASTVLLALKLDFFFEELNYWVVVSPMLSQALATLLFINIQVVVQATLPIVRFMWVVSSLAIGIFLALLVLHMENSWKILEKWVMAELFGPLWTGCAFLLFGAIWGFYRSCKAAGSGALLLNTPQGSLKDSKFLSAPTNLFSRQEDPSQQYAVFASFAILFVILVVPLLILISLKLGKLAKVLTYRLRPVDRLVSVLHFPLRR